MFYIYTSYSHTSYFSPPIGRPLGPVWPLSPHNVDYWHRHSATIQTASRKLSGQWVAQHWVQIKGVSDHGCLYVAIYSCLVPSFTTVWCKRKAESTSVHGCLWFLWIPQYLSRTGNQIIDDPVFNTEQKTLSTGMFCHSFYLLAKETSTIDCAVFVVTKLDRMTHNMVDQ